MQADETKVQDMVRGTKEYVRGRFYCDAAVTLGAQDVEVRVRPADWQAASWQGSVGDPGDPRRLLSDAVFDTAGLEPGYHDVLGRLVDNSETPIVLLGVWRVAG